MPPKRAAAVKGNKQVKQSAVKRPVPVDADQDDEYRRRRELNNIAVKKSRAKSRARTQMTAAKVTELQRENTELEERIKMLSKELDLLKELFVLQAGKKNNANTDEDAMASQSSTASAAASPDLIDQDHGGYVSQIKRLRKTR